MRRAKLPPSATPMPIEGVELLGQSAEPARPPGTLLPASRLRLLWRFILAALLLLFLQGGRLQVASGSLFFRRAEENRVREIVEYAPRGIFLDRHGTPLVQNVPTIQLVADPGRLPDDLERLFAALAEALPTRDLAAVHTQLAVLDRSEGSPVPLLADLTETEYLALESRLDRLPGLRTETSAVRDYRGNGPFAHALGYTGKLSAEERSQFPGYLLTESVGKTGLERQYESLLRGRHGVKKVEVDAEGTIQQDLGREPAEPGVNLRLHLDAGLQETIAETLARGAALSGSHRGAAVALDPSSGGIRSLVSLPLYPHSDLARGLGGDTVRRVLADPSSPLLNRAIQGQYVPGSSFKLAVAAGALEEKVVTPPTTVESTGGIRVDRWFFPDWKPGGHGKTTLVKALAESVNTYFYIAAGGFEERRGLGIERLTAWAQRLSFGAPTGIDLPEEASGFLPSPEWKEREKQEAWYIGDTYHAAIGQGDVLTTPLQLAVAAATIANGGTLLAPHLADASVSSDGTIRERFAPAVRAERALSPETAAAILAGMRAAVTEGSARSLAALPAPVAAKTGTAQIGGTDRTHAWVTVVAPVENPELVLVILVEAGGGGDRVAVPIAREILAWYFGNTENRLVR